MTNEKEVVKTESVLGNLGGCLVEGTAEDKARGRKSKRRAIAISVGLQTVGLTALVIAPLLAKPAELAVRNVTPIPPYSHAPSQRHETTTRQREWHETIYRLGDPRPLSEVMRRRTEALPEGPAEPPDFSNLPGGSGPSTGLGIVDAGVQPKKPDEQGATKKRLVVGHIDPAQLTRRVEPLYPALAIQIRRAGKVELHAIIATDGSIQSMEVVSGDPLFVRSALDAVGQWRYKPTYLNGQPVEIDTFITVIYSMPQ